MTESFIFKGVSSDDMKVCLRTLLADGSKTPGTRYEKINVDGRDGGIYAPAGYDDIERDLSLVLLDRSKETEVRAWLSGEGTLRIGQRQKTARFYAPLEIGTSPGRTSADISTSVILDPFWVSSDAWATVQSGGTVRNAGNVPSAPLVRVTATAAGTVTVGGMTIGIDPDRSGQVTIDCASCSEDKPAWVSLGWEYPRLPVGDSAITCTGGIIRVEMMRLSRWI